MRILQVTPWFPPHTGGIATYVSNLCAQLIALGYDVSVLTVKPRKELTSSNNAYPASLREINYIDCFYLPGWPYPTLKSVSIPWDAGAKIRSSIKHGDFDIIHVHGIHYPISWLAIYYAHKKGIRSVLSLHGSYALNPHVLSGESLMEKWIYRNLFSKIFSRAEAILSPARSITCLAKAHCRNSSTAFFTVGLGIQASKFSANLEKKMEYRVELEISEDSIVILFVGRFEKVKGILEFCAAAKRIIEESDRKVEVLIVGGGSLNDKVFSSVRNRRGIHIVGWQHQENIAKFYISSDVFVLPSRFEGVPVTLLEAMSAGLHIVYSPVGGIPEIVENYSAKTLLAEVSADEIHRTITNLLGSHRVTRNAEDLRYVNQFDWSVVVSRIQSVYSKLLDN